MLLSRNYLRRRDARRRVMFGATVECRGAVQNVRVVDFSPCGLRIDGSKGLTAGDPIRLILRPDLDLSGDIAWAVWHKAGIKFQEPLTDEHPAYVFLLEQAEAIERVRTLALVALAKDRARR
ncbi:MAG: PilZ domain-containing protein [Proteobacteria bacterium]|nr:PilZ domain-containing protein [Pseudomonadota bacterium]